MPSPLRSAGFRWCVVAPLMLVVCLVSVLFVTFHVVRAEAIPKRDKIVAELDASDPNWRTTALMAERNARLPPPDQNAAVLAARAHDQAPKAYTEWNNNSTDWVSDLTAPHLPHRTDVAELRKQLAGARQAVELARAVRHTTGGGFAYEYKEPDIIGTSLEPQQRLRRAMGLLMHDAMLRAYDRDADGALDSCLGILAVARGTGDDPWLISQLIRMAGVAISIGATERTLGWAGGCDDAKLAALDQAFAAEVDAPRLLYGLRGERAMFYRICENIDSGAMNEDPFTAARPSPFSRLQSVPIRMRIPENQAVGLDMYTRMMEAAKLPPGNARRLALGAVEDDFFTRFRRSRYFGLGGPLMLVSLLMPATAKLNEADTRTVAWLNAARVAIACERHRQKAGAFPTTLDELPKELMAEVPTDPWTGNPILYKKLPDGAVAYSAGYDGVDDGAVKLNPKSEKGNDLGFRLWTLDARRKPPEPKTNLIVGSPGPGSPPGSFFDFSDKPKPGAPTAPPPLSPWVKPEK